MIDLSHVPVVAFPLRGEWRATNTPAERVPSHGTDFFAQRYALDFVQTDVTGTWFYDGGTRQLLRHLVTGMEAARFHCWDAPVRSATSGRVIGIGDGWPDRTRVQLVWELVRGSVLPPRVQPGHDYRPLTGNYVIVESAVGFALYGHLRCRSIGVKIGDVVESGDPLGAVGNSGNSTMPHLHFQLMDGPDPFSASARLCAFGEYERWRPDSSGRDGRWERVSSGVPGAWERVRA